MSWGPRSGRSSCSQFHSATRRFISATSAGGLPRMSLTGPLLIHSEIRGYPSVNEASGMNRSGKSGVSSPPLPIVMHDWHGGCRILALAHGGIERLCSRHRRRRCAARVPALTGWKGVLGSLRLPDVKPPCILTPGQGRGFSFLGSFSSVSPPCPARAEPMHSIPETVRADAAGQIP